MSTDPIGLVDTTCSVCGAEVRGEKVVWKEYSEGQASEDQQNRMAETHVNKSGGYVCRTCGNALCSKEHKKDVENVKFMRGYWLSPCPQCGDALLDGFILAQAPEGSFEAPAAEASSISGEASPVEVGPVTVDVSSIQWKTEPLNDGVLAFTCPHCNEAHTFSSGLFPNLPAEGVDGLTSTDHSVGNRVLPVLLSFATAVAVFIWVHRAVFGPEIRPGLHLLLPAFAAVIAHALANPVFSSLPFIVGKTMPVFEYACSECGGQTHIASDGKRFAVPNGRSK
jgi:hypothetical protein